ncbi:tyrosine-type recombinase/integrase [Parerythrobacter aurantius]|uniref:tyrosine-type recombinase/integrase n=1 Tax=Parerythrobacter aurantius TaxID=3127706 RepID=UPI00324A9F6C
MPRKSTTRLTQQLCDTVEAPTKSAKLYRCSDTRGLGLKAYPSGRKAFVFSYMAPDKREKRITIGELGPWKIGAARKRAEELRRLVDQGIDPAIEKKTERDAVGLREYWHWYRDSLLAKRSEAHQRDFKASWERKILPHLGPYTKLKQLSQSDIQAFLDRVTKESGPIYSNRCHSHLRVVLARAEVEGLISKKPAGKGVIRDKEEGRERYLTVTEMKRLSIALNKRRGDASADAIAVLMMTGARKSEVLAMRYDEISFQSAHWDIPSFKTKQRRRQRVHLSNASVEILTQRKKSANGQEFVFPGIGHSGRLTEVRKTFESLLAECKITNCRLNDLRHSFASLLVSKGASLEVIGALLGHSQPHTTKRYAHLYDEALKEAAQSVTNALE